MTPEKFFDLLLYCSSLSNRTSLEQSVTILHDRYKVNIAKQSLDNRFNEKAVVFINEILKQVLETELTYFFRDKVLSDFNYVRIKDSTKFNVDDRLLKHFKGTGGGKGTRKASVCIQYEYDIKSGKVLDLTILPGASSDSTNAKETKCNINKKDLVIRDLGYYNLDTLWSFHENGAFFISRLNMTSKVFDCETETEICLKKVYSEMVDKNITIKDYSVLVSKNKKYKLRMIITVVPEHAYEKRIRLANKRNKDRGYSTSDEYKVRARLNIFITNIPHETMPTEELLLLYKLRWQIELMFKTWKSICSIDKIQPMKYERFMCLLMVKLILIIIKLKLYWNFYEYYFLKGKILSLHKSFTTFQNTYHKFELILKSTQAESRKNVKMYLNIFSKNHWKEKRKERKNYEEIIGLFICNTDDYGYIEEVKTNAAENLSAA